MINPAPLLPPSSTPSHRVLAALGELALQARKPSPRAPFDLCVLTARELLRADLAVLSLWDEKAQGLTLTARAGHQPSRLDSLAAEVLQRVFAQGDPARIDLGTGWGGPAKLTLLAVPIETAGQRLGVLSVCLAADRSEDPDEQLILELVAAHIAPIVDLDRRGGGRERAARTLTAFRAIAEAAEKHGDPLAIAQATMEQARILLEAESAAVAWWDGSGLRSHFDIEPPGAKRLWKPEKGPLGRTFRRMLEPGRGPLGRAYATGEAQLVQGYRGWENTTDNGFSTALAVPTRNQDGTIGALMVRYRQPRELGPEEVGLLTTLAAQIGPSLEAARLSANLAAAEARLAERADDLAEATRLKSEFLAKMSHELRTPLSAIIGFSDLILDGADGDLNADLAEDVGQINRSGKALLDLINDILDLSKIEAGRMVFEIEAVSMLRVVDDVLKIARPSAESKGLRLDVEFEGDEAGLVAACDAARSRQVLGNLISNAIKFTTEGGITVRCLQTGPDVEVSVTDTGIGIEAEAQERIFDEFVQADGSSSRRFGGTGLGLAISRRLVEMQGGAIGLESKLGEGSRFWFRLPLYAGASGVEDTAPAEPRRAWPGQTRDVILIVDDEPSIRNLICRRLDEAGFVTMQARNGEEALAIAREEHPAAITLDVMMPNTDGWQVLQRLKSSRSTRDIPVVVVSIVDGHETAMELGAAGYLTKPFSKTQLTRTIQQILPNLKGADVLCVDDEPAMRDLMRKSLRASGVGVRVVASGKEALEEVDRKIPDAMMVDLMMPEMNGIELIFRLRSRPELEKTPIIVVSAKELDEDDLHALGGAIDRFIAKSELREWDLAATVRQALRERQNRSADQGRPRRRVQIPPLPNLSIVKAGGVPVEQA